MSTLEDIAAQLNDLDKRLQRVETTDWLIWDLICSVFFGLPGLRGFWPMRTTTGAPASVVDLSGGNSSLVRFGNPLYSYSGLAPTLIFDGVGDYVRILDAAKWDITGTEPAVNVPERGLFAGVWVYPTVVGALQAIIGKWNAAGNQRSYLIDLSAGNNFRAHVSVDGTADTLVTSTVPVVADNWYFVETTYDPSARLAINVNGTITQNVAAIPASIHSGTANVNVAAQDNGTANLLTGWLSIAFIGGMYHTDLLTQSVYHHTRAVYR